MLALQRSLANMKKLSFPSVFSSGQTTLCSPHVVPYHHIAKSYRTPTRSLYRYLLQRASTSHRKCTARSLELMEFTFFGPLVMDRARTSKEHSSTRCSSHVSFDVWVWVYLQVCSAASSPCLLQYPIGYVLSPLPTQQRFLCSKSLLHCERAQTTSV